MLIERLTGETTGNWMRDIFKFWIAALITASTGVGAQEHYDGPIIDMHLHPMSNFLTTADGKPLPRICNPQPCQSPPAEANSSEDVLRLTLETMRQNNIVLGFLSGASLEDVYRWQEAAPGRFIASPSFDDPNLIDLQALREDYQSGRLGGMGELGIQYEGIAVGDPRVMPFFLLAEEFDVPVLIHHHGTGGPSGLFRISLGHPEQLEEILIQHPKLRLFIETSGFPFLEETIALMYRYPNVYGDLSLWKYPPETANRYLRDLVRAGLGKRLMFGSDQMQWPNVIDEMIDLINSANYLSQEQKQDIFYHNAARFLQLSDEKIAEHHSR